LQSAKICGKKMSQNFKILALLILVGFGLRVTQLGAIGFAEDEMNKLDAIHAYERGDFSANSEHPMVMKVLMWASLRGIPAGSEEAALRFPNALIGALTVRSATGPVYVIVQRGRTYFENREGVEYVRARFRRVHEITIQGANAVEVFVQD